MAKRQKIRTTKDLMFPVPGDETGEVVTIKKGTEFEVEQSTRGNVQISIKGKDKVFGKFLGKGTYEYVTGGPEPEPEKQTAEPTTTKSKGK